MATPENSKEPKDHRRSQQLRRNLCGHFGTSVIAGFRLESYPCVASMPAQFRGISGFSFLHDRKRPYVLIINDARSILAVASAYFNSIVRVVE